MTKQKKKKLSTASRKKRLFIKFCNLPELEKRRLAEPEIGFVYDDFRTQLNEPDIHYGSLRQMEKEIDIVVKRANKKQ